MPAVRIASPATAPVPLDTVKLALRIDHDDEDGYLSDVVIPAAVDAVERFLGRALVSQRWRLTLDRWPAVVLLPKPPLLAVVSIACRPPGGEAMPLPASAYVVDPAATPGRIMPAAGTCWPLSDGGAASITVDYDAGYGAPADVPPVFVSAVLATAGYLYAHREAAAGVPEPVRKTLAHSRVRWFGECS